MLRPLLSPALLASLVLLATSAHAQTPVNANGGFESTDLGVVTDLAGGIDGWVLEANVSPAPEFAVVDDVTHTGDRALRITVKVK